MADQNWFVLRFFPQLVERIVLGWGRQHLFKGWDRHDLQIGPQFLQVADLRSKLCGTEELVASHLIQEGKVHRLGISDAVQHDLSNIRELSRTLETLTDWVWTL